MAVFSAIYILASVTFFKLDMGDASLVYANILNLSARIAYCVSFCTHYFTRNDARQVLHWRTVFPSWSLLITAMASYGVVKYSEKTFGMERVLRSGKRSPFLLLSRPVFLHVCVGGGAALLCVGVWWISSGRKLIRSRRPKNE